MTYLKGSGKVRQKTSGWPSSTGMQRIRSPEGVIPGAEGAREVALLVAAYGKAERSNMLPSEINKVV